MSLLVDRSLVYTTKGVDQSQRYNRLETLRQFEYKKLHEQKEEEAIRQLHLDYYLKLSEQAYAEQFQSQLKWLNKLEQEHDNLVAALNWSLTESRKMFILLAGYLGWFWYLHSHLILGKYYMEKAISDDTEKSEAYARVLTELGRHAFYSTEKSEPIELMKKSLNIWRKTKNLRELAIVLSSLGRHASRTDDPETA
jgi:non-specific serine/threonine protein kinase